MSTTPSNSNTPPHGYKMPAEWEPHAATWMVWPQNSDDWPGKFGPIAWVYADIVRHLSPFERVHLIVDNAGVESRARRVLMKTGVDLGNVRFHHWPTNRGWTRDSGPIFVKGDGKVGVTNWGFNAWAKYDDWPLDDRLPHLVAECLGFDEWTPSVAPGRWGSLPNNGEAVRFELECEVTGRRLVLEGGSIDVNGAGLMLTTEECLLSPIQERNPGVDRIQLEAAFRDYLGVRKVIWLGNGIVGDDTHGHVDDIARFVDADTVVTVVEADPSDDNYPPLLDNLERLRGATDIEGRPLRIIELPMPAPVVFNGQRLPASYANFYIANGVVLVPTFNDPNDRVALEILAGLFPDRHVVGIHGRDLIWGLGALHCMTQQQPG